VLITISNAPVLAGFTIRDLSLITYHLSRIFNMEEAEWW
jgi:hypothetical protein